MAEKTTKNKQTLWVKKRHARVFAFLRFAMAGYVRLKFHYHAEKAPIESGPCIILHNHQATMDPFFISKAFRFPVYFVATDDLFNLKVSPLIRYLAAPIPKSKGTTDLATVKNILRVLKEGGAVGIAPEGNRTFSGRQWETVPFSITKLVKKSNVPLVLFTLYGGYGKAVYTALATVGGMTAGIVATAKSSINHHCTAKAARFIRLCGSTRSSGGS